MFKRGEIDFTESTFINQGVDAHAEIFLVVGAEVFH